MHTCQSTLSRNLEWVVSYGSLLAHINRAGPGLVGRPVLDPQRDRLSQ